MAKASYKKVYGKTTADIMVSEGIAPATYFFPDDSLPTLWYHSFEDQRYEVLIPKGTILALKVDGADGAYTPVFTICDMTANPVGVAQYHLFRPFDKGTSQGAGWIRRGYIKYPYIPSVLDPYTATVSPGDYVRSDHLGRFCKWAEFNAAHSLGSATTKIVGQIIDIQKFGVTFDTQLMEYLTWPHSHYEDDFAGKLNTLTQDRPGVLATADYVAMYETGVTTSPMLNTEAGEGIDDALDRYGSQGMVTIALML
jgi:hypothetical protein